MRIGKRRSNITRSRRDLAMPPPPRRRFTLFDAMILVAATAVGFALLRDHLSWLYEDLPLRIDYRPTSDRSWHSGSKWSYCALLGTWPLPAAWTIAVLGLNLRRSRP